MSTTLQRLPIVIQGFEKIHTLSCPRRFGKRLLLSTIK